MCNSEAMVVVDGNWVFIDCRYVCALQAQGSLDYIEHDAIQSQFKCCGSLIQGEWDDEKGWMMTVMK